MRAWRNILFDQDLIGPIFLYVKNQRITKQLLFLQAAKRNAMQAVASPQGMRFNARVE